MFGFGKKENPLQERMERLEERILSAGDERKKEAEDISARLSELRGAANKHDMAIADMLDTWEEWQQSWGEEQARNASLADRYRREAAEGVRRENALLELAIACHDQLYALRRAAAESGDAVWERQLELAEEALSGGRLPAELQVIDRKGAPVDYGLHEVVGVVETEDDNQAMRVADVYACGYAYRGQVVRKAKVTAFRKLRVESPDSSI